MDIIDIDYSDKLVAFIDILGFRNYVFQNAEKSKDKIKLINDVLNHAINIVTNNSSEDTFSVKLFSDCICISSKSENIHYLILELAYIQCWFSMHGIFLRGSLTRGLHYESPNIIFSQALIKAYDYEKTAIYPRIIIDSTLAKSINDTTYIMKSPDRLFFVDYLNFIYAEGNSDGDKILEGHKEAILNQVREHAEDTKIIEKYRWLSEYHNIKANEYIGKAEDWENNYYSELQNKIVIQMSRYFPYFNKPKQ